MPPKANLPPETIEWLGALRRKGLGWGALAVKAGMSYTGVRRLLDPEFRERANRSASAHERRSVGQKRRPTKRRAPAPLVMTEEAEVGSFRPQPKRNPPDLRWRSDAAEMLGEPAIGRSALDQRNGARLE